MWCNSKYSIVKLCLYFIVSNNQSKFENIKIFTLRKLYLILCLLLSCLSSSSQSRHISSTTKKIVFTRDSGICQCCGASQNLEYDHIIPYSCGGSSSVNNIQLLCQKCNRSKSNSCICKVHNKRVGSSCCENKINKTASGNSSQCTGLTKKGARCRKTTTKSNGRCHLH